MVVRAAANVPDPSIERYSSSRATATHVVKSGETLGRIAQRYNTTPAVLMKTNRLKRPLIFAGQSLIVPAQKPKASARSTATKTKAPASRPAPNKAD